MFPHEDALNAMRMEMRTPEAKEIYNIKTADCRTCTWRHKKTRVKEDLLREASKA